jgi:hypothetical protein
MTVYADDFEGAEGTPIPGRTLPVGGVAWTTIPGDYTNLQLSSGQARQVAGGQTPVAYITVDDASRVHLRCKVHNINDNPPQAVGLYLRSGNVLLTGPGDHRITLSASFAGSDLASYDHGIPLENDGMLEVVSDLNQSTIQVWWQGTLVINHVRIGSPNDRDFGFIIDETSETGIDDFRADGGGPVAPPPTLRSWAAAIAC